MRGNGKFFLEGRYKRKSVKDRKVEDVRRIFLERGRSKKREGR